VSGQTTLTGDGFGTIQKVTVSINSLYDPDYSGVGSVPRYYQALLGSTTSYAPYSKYCVMGAKLRAVFISQANTISNLGDVGVYVRPASGSALNSSAEMYETELGKAATIGSGYADTGICSIQADVSQRLLAQLQNCKDLEDSAVNWGAYNGDPSSEILCDFMFLPYQTSSTGALYLRWTIEYDALLFGLNDIDQTQLKPPKSAETIKPAVHVAGCLCEQCKSPKR